MTKIFAGRSKDHNVVNNTKVVDSYELLNSNESDSFFNDDLLGHIPSNL